MRKALPMIYGGCLGVVLDLMGYPVYNFSTEEFIPQNLLIMGLWSVIAAILYNKQ